jgi:hypothetical protein
MIARTTLRAAVAGLVLLSSLAGGLVARADEWDIGPGPDGDVLASENTLFHGSAQIHDLGGHGVIDQDWYKFSSPPFSSYQVVVDGQTGDLDFGPDDVQRYDVTGTHLMQSATEQSGVLTLDWLTFDAPSRDTIVVQGAACATACGVQDRYRLRFYDTTYTIPRFNDSGSQVTVLLIQNVTNRPCILITNYLLEDGSLLVSGNVLINPGTLTVVPPFSILPGHSGSIRIAHGCGYGGLSGKAVALEPATGFTFDTPLVPRPH